MAVLDVRSLPADKVKMLAKTYEAVCGLELLPVAQLDKDPARIQIDDALSKVLGLPDLAGVRELLAREPGLSAIEINPRPGEDVPEEEESEQAVSLLTIPPPASCAVCKSMCAPSRRRR